MHVRCDRPVQIKIRHSRPAKESVELGEECFNGHVRHDLIQIDQPADALSPDTVDALIYFAKQLADGRIESVIRLHPMRLRLKAKFVRCVVLAEELAVEAVRKLVLEQIAEAIAKLAREKRAVDRLDERIQAL